MRPKNKQKKYQKIITQNNKTKNKRGKERKNENIIICPIKT